MNEFEWSRKDFLGELDVEVEVTAIDKAVLTNDMAKIAQTTPNPQRFYDNGKRLIARIVSEN